MGRSASRGIKRPRRNQPAAVEAHRLCGSPCAANGLMLSRVPAAADLEEVQPILAQMPAEAEIWLLICGELLGGRRGCGRRRGCPAEGCRAAPHPAIGGRTVRMVPAQAPRGAGAAGLRLPLTWFERGGTCSSSSKDAQQQEVVGRRAATPDHRVSVSEVAP